MSLDVGEKFFMRVFSGDGNVTSVDGVDFGLIRVPGSVGIGRQRKVSEGKKFFGGVKSEAGSQEPELWPTDFTDLHRLFE